MIEISDSGNLMVKAYMLSKALGFSYKNYDGSFVIKRSSARYNTYNKNNLKYTYTNESVNTVKPASNAAYTSKISKYNLCQVSTLSTLVYYKYFNNSDTKNHPGYRGIICYSRYKIIPAELPAAEPKPTKEPTPTPNPEPTKIMVEGVEFPVRESFLPVNEAFNDWGGGAAAWYKLEQEVDGKIIAATDLIIGSDKIEFTHLVADSNCISLAKTRNGYKISISVRLSGSVLAEQNAAILKAMVATISSKPIFVYTAIFESFTTNETHGINEDKYVTIGDCKIKVEIKNDVVSYLILEA